MRVRAIEPLNKECWTCEKTGKLCVPFSLGAPYYIKLPSESRKSSMPPFAIWHHVRGCVGIESSWSAAVKTANASHEADVMRWIEISDDQ